MKSDRPVVSASHPSGDKTKDDKREVPTEVVEQFREVEAILVEVQKSQALRADARSARLEKLRAVVLQPEQESLLREYVRLVIKEEGRVATPSPANPEVHALLAGFAAREVVSAEGEVEARHADLSLVLGETGADSDAVRIKKIDAAVEQERMARQHVQALQKMASEERIASLTIEVKQLEGDHQRSLAKIEDEKARALAAEDRASQLERAKVAAETALGVETAKGDGAAKVERIKGWHLVLVALLTGGGGCLGGRLLPMTNAPAASPTAAFGERDAGSQSDATTTAQVVTFPPPPNVGKRCVLRPVGIRGLKHPEFVSLRLELGYGSIPERHVWITADKVGGGGDIEVPCHGEIHPRLATGDSRKSTIEPSLGEFQAALDLSPGPKQTFELGALGSDAGSGVFVYEVLPGDGTPIRAGE